MFVELSSKYSFPPCNHNRPNYCSRDTSISPHWNDIHLVVAEGHLGLVMRVPGCGDLVISQEQVIGGERCEDCSGATRSHLSSEANVTFMEHFNGRTMFRNFVSHLVNFYKDQGLIHQRFSRNAQNISSGFNTNFDVSVSQCSGQWSSGPMVRDTT